MINKTISCDLHDYFEIVCMRHSNVQLGLLNGETIEGRALDIVTIEQTEFITLSTFENETIEIALMSIQVLSAINNPQKDHNFTIQINTVTN